MYSWKAQTKPAHEFWEQESDDEPDDIISALSSTTAQKEEIVRTRSGYIAADVVRGLYQAMTDNGTIAGGRLLHYTSELICSGGFQIWERFLYDFALEHIGIASPRIFIYLSKRLAELGAYSRSLPDEDMWRMASYQKKVAEIALIMKDCPRRGKPKIPRIDSATHRNSAWIDGFKMRATASNPVKKVWRQREDMEVLYIAATEMATAVADGATEKALYWLKWLIEEETAYKKEFAAQVSQGAGSKKAASAAAANVALSMVERGPAGLKTSKRLHVGYYIAEILAEIYKEIALQGHIKMHEEFQALLNLYRSATAGLTARRKMDILCLMTQICAEVPRWKVAAAPVLVRDAIVLQRMSDQAPTFFSEVLQHPALMKPLGKKSLKAPPKKPAPKEEASAYDTAMDAYMARMGMK